MKSARIVIKHRGLVLLDMPIRLLLARLGMDGQLVAAGFFPPPDKSTVIEVITDQWTQVEPWIVPEEEEEEDDE